MQHVVSCTFWVCSNRIYNREKRYITLRSRSDAYIRVHVHYYIVYFDVSSRDDWNYPLGKCDQIKREIFESSKCSYYSDDPCVIPREGAFFVRRRRPQSVLGAQGRHSSPKLAWPCPRHGAKPFQALFTPQHPPALHAPSARSLLQASLTARRCCFGRKGASFREKKCYFFVLRW